MTCAVTVGAGFARRPLSHTLRNLSLEFGPAELLDSFLVRPLAMYLGPIVVGSLTAGVILGKIAADVVFYTLAIVGYEFGKKLSNDPVAAGLPAAMLAVESRPPPNSDPNSRRTADCGTEAPWTAQPRNR